MKIFRLRPVMPAKGARSRPAPLLECKPSAKHFLAGDRFRGEPFPGDWKRTDLNFGNQVPWQADFYFYGPGALVCSGRARDVLAPLEDEGEFLPVKVTGIRGDYFLFNSFACRSYLNEAKSTVRKPTANDGAPNISKHGFWTSRIGDECLFKLEEGGALDLYCIERTADPCDGEFRALVKEAGLTGVAFETVWTSGKAPNLTKSSDQR
jgi:hypothetical protein